MSEKEPKKKKWKHGLYDVVTDISIELVMRTLLRAVWRIFD